MLKIFEKCIVYVCIIINYLSSVSVFPYSLKKMLALGMFLGYKFSGSMEKSATSLFLFNLLTFFILVPLPNSFSYKKLQPVHVLIEAKLLDNSDNIYYQLHHHKFQRVSVVSFQYLCHILTGSRIYSAFYHLQTKGHLP